MNEKEQRNFMKGCLNAFVLSLLFWVLVGMVVTVTK